MVDHSFQRTKGIILRVIPFRDYDQILTIFTFEAGLIKVLYKGSRSKRRGVQGICMPLTVVEIVYREKKGEIFSCHEMGLIEAYHDLRQELKSLEVACDLLQVVASSQLVCKPAPQLYDLLCFYLHKIPQIGDPWTLAVSFRLKLLKYEGLIAFPFTCEACQRPLVDEAYLREEEWRCADHCMRGSSHWSETELQQLYQMTNCLSYREIADIRLSCELKQAMMRFFYVCQQQ